MLQDLLQSKKEETIIEEEVKDKTVLDEISSRLDEARKSQGFMMCLSHLYTDEKNNERLKHHLFTVRFKGGDVTTSIQEYEKLAENELKRRQLEKAPVGSAPAPVEENSEYKIED